MRERSDTLYLRENARTKATSTHETMGLVSAIIAGFDVTALVEVDLCGQGQQPCTGAEDGFIACASLVIGLSMFIVIEAALEYGFVLRELHYGHEAVWELMNKLRKYRKLAESAFVINLLMFLISTIFMLIVRDEQRGNVLSL